MVNLPEKWADTLGTAGEEHPLPSFEAAYVPNAGIAEMNVLGAASAYTVDPNGIDEDVSSNLAGIGGKFDLGLVTLAGDIWYGQNVGQLGMYHRTADDAVVSGNTIEDTESWGGILVATLKATDMLAVEAGVGYTESDNDTYVSADDERSYYANCVISLASGWFIVPENGYFDKDDTSAGLDEGDFTYAGAKFQINF